MTHFQSWEKIGHRAKHSSLAPLTAHANHFFFLICRWGETRPLGNAATIVPHAPFVHRKYIWIDLDSKPGIYGEKLVWWKLEQLMLLYCSELQNFKTANGAVWQKSSRSRIARNLQKLGNRK